MTACGRLREPGKATADSAEAPQGPSSLTLALRPGEKASSASYVAV